MNLSVEAVLNAGGDIGVVLGDIDGDERENPHNHGDGSQSEEIGKEATFFAVFLHGATSSSLGRQCGLVEAGGRERETLLYDSIPLSRLLQHFYGVR